MVDPGSNGPRSSSDVNTSRHAHLGDVSTLRYNIRPPADATPPRSPAKNSVASATFFRSEVVRRMASSTRSCGANLPRNPSSLISASPILTHTWNTAASSLLTSLFPDDQFATRPLQQLLDTLPFSPDVTPLWTPDEILNSLELTPPRKAPGPDRIEASMILALLDHPSLQDAFGALVWPSVTSPQFRNLLWFALFLNHPEGPRRSSLL